MGQGVDRLAAKCPAGMARGGAALRPEPELSRAVPIPDGPAPHLRLLTDEELAAAAPRRLHLGLAASDPARGERSLRAPERPHVAPFGTPDHAPLTRPAPFAIPASLPPAAPGDRGLPLGERLMRRGALGPGDLQRALALQEREDTRLGEILVAHGMADEADVMGAIADQWCAEALSLATARPDPRLADEIGPAQCLALGVVPIRRIGGTTLVASARPEGFGAHRAEVERRLGPVCLALATEAEVAAAIGHLRGSALAGAAEATTPHALSCRDWKGRRTASLAVGLATAFGLAAALAPLATLWALVAIVMTTLIATASLKALALGQLVRSLWAARRLRRIAARAERAIAAPVTAPDTGMAAEAAPRAEPRTTTGPALDLRKLPRISMMVPLFEEDDLAHTLLPRLARLRYPHELTDILLLVEERDHATAAALTRVRLPRHIRAISVPPGTVMTKPRALNYGLGFARGEIIGIWDAEDAPDPDQLHRVAARFAQVAPRVVCLQGALDFYNSRTNWLSRCFTLEYGTWFRAFLPGLQGLDLPIPLGGTTLFFRRAPLEALGGWDAHNVTEDADLGIRLYRAGWRTEIVDTTTQEEANCRFLPWVRQRSRWLKGYAITWAVHMRRPRQLWREMGPAGFLGFNTLFVGTLAQFVLMPVMLSFWLLALGTGHPLTGHVPIWLGWAFLGLFATAEAISLALTFLGNRRRGRRGLLWWVPTLHLYYPLATLAAYKGLWELVSRPFYWDKTEHGLHGEEAASAHDPDREAATETPQAQTAARVPAVAVAAE